MRVLPIATLLILLAPAPSFAAWTNAETTSDALAARGAALLGASAYALPRTSDYGGPPYWISVDVTYWRLDGTVYRCSDTAGGHQHCVVASKPEAN